MTEAVCQPSVFKCRAQPIKNHPVVTCKFETSNKPDTSFESHVLLDTGSDDTILPFNSLPTSVHSLIEPTAHAIKGVGAAPVPIKGYLKVNLFIGPGVWYDIKATVLDKPIPTLIGRDVLQHDIVDEVTFRPKSVVFQMNKPKPTTFELATLDPPESFNTISLPSDLELRVNKLKSEKQVTLPSHLSHDELSSLVDLLEEFSDIFATDKSPIGTFPGSVRIHTLPGEARSMKQHPVPEAYRSSVDAEIQKMLDQGVVEPCPDPRGWNTPLHVVPKKNGDIRIVSNFKRTVNQVLSSESDFAWQMPSADEIFNEIGLGNLYFSSVDLKAGYWQIQVDPRDRHKFAFQWRNKTYQYCRVPFGWTIAGQTFSRCVSKALAEVQNQGNYKMYVDDVLVHSKCVDTQITTLRQIFTALRSHGLKLNSKKCIFIQPKGEFLGRVVEPTGYRACPNNISAIQELKPPTSKAELLTTIGQIVWLRNFIETRVGERVRTKAFSVLIRELNLLNRKDRKFEWPEAANKSFENVKERLSSAPIIQFADFRAPFVLVTDASEVACGAVLLQQQNGKEVIVAVASCTFNTTEQRWCATERECYALMWAMEKFSYFLRGRTFLVQTDHKSLVYVDKTTFNNSKIQRWQERMSEFTFVVEYLEGSSNVFADLLSRPNGMRKTVLPKSDTPAGEFKRIGNSELMVYIPSWVKGRIGDLKLNPVTPKLSHMAQCFNGTKCSPENGDRISDLIQLAADQRDDPFLATVISALKQNKCLADSLDQKDHRGRLYTRFAENLYIDPFTDALMIRSETCDKVIVPPELRPHFLYLGHDNNAHAGRHRARISLQRFWWPKMAHDIQHYVDSCIHCARRKGSYGNHTKPTIGHVLRGEKPFEVCYIDFVHLPNGLNGKKYMCTILDSFSRYLIAVPTCRDRAIDAVNALLYELILKFDTVPKVLSSDRGTHFTSSVMSEVCQKFGIKQQLHVAWRPQSSGSIERAHRTLKNAIFATCAEKLCDWTEALPFVVNAMNSAINTSTGVSPRQVIFGEKSTFRLPEVTGEQMTSSSPRSYGHNLRLIRERVHHLVRLSAEAADRQMEQRHQRSHQPVELKPTDKVLIHRPQSAEAKRSKLPWIGPFEICETNQRIVRITDSNGDKDWVHREDVRLVTPRRQSLDRNPAILLPEPPNFTDPALLPIRKSSDSPNEPVRPKTGEPKVEVSDRPTPKTPVPEPRKAAGPKSPIYVPPQKRVPELQPTRKSTRIRAQPARYSDSDYRVVKR